MCMYSLGGVGMGVHGVCVCIHVIECIMHVHVQSLLTSVMGMCVHERSACVCIVYYACACSHNLC